MVNNIALGLEKKEMVASWTYSPSLYTSCRHMRHRPPNERQRVRLPGPTTAYYGVGFIFVDCDRAKSYFISAENCNIGPETVVDWHYRRKCVSRPPVRFCQTLFRPPRNARWSRPESFTRRGPRCGVAASALSAAERCLVSAKRHS